MFDSTDEEQRQTGDARGRRPEQMPGRRRRDPDRVVGQPRSGRHACVAAGALDDTVGAQLGIIGEKPDQILFRTRRHKDVLLALQIRQLGRRLSEPLCVVVKREPFLLERSFVHFFLRLHILRVLAVHQIFERRSLIEVRVNGQGDLADVVLRKLHPGKAERVRPSGLSRILRVRHPPDVCQRAIGSKRALQLVEVAHAGRVVLIRVRLPQYRRQGDGSSDGERLRLGGGEVSGWTSSSRGSHRMDRP